MVVNLKFIIIVVASFDFMVNFNAVAMLHFTAVIAISNLAVEWSLAAELNYFLGEEDLVIMEMRPFPPKSNYFANEFNSVTIEPEGQLENNNDAIA